MTLIDEGGRVQSRRTTKDYIALAQQDLEALSPEEFEVFQEIIKDFSSYGKSPAFEIASRALYRTPPVDMNTWLDDPYFCGALTKDLFPVIREDLEEVFNGRYNECLIGGSIGCVAEETLLETEKGPIPAGDIRAPTRYVSWDSSSGSFRFQAGTAAFPKGRGVLYRIVHERGEFIAFGSHLLLCADGMYRSVERLLFDPLPIASPAFPLPEPLAHRKQVPSRSPGAIPPSIQKVLDWLDSASAQAASHLDPLSLLPSLRDIGVPMAVQQVSLAAQAFGGSFLRPSEKDSSSWRSPLWNAFRRLMFLPPPPQGRSQRASRRFSDNSPFLQASFGEGQTFEDREGLSLEQYRFAGPIDASFSRRQPVSSEAQFVPQYKARSFGPSRQSLRGGIIGSSILSIEKVRSDWYWDLQVSGTHNYVAHEAIHHNSGKTTFVKFAMLRMIYEASCLQNPQEAYGISHRDKIAFPCISVTEGQAHELVFEKIRACVEDSPYFQKEFNPEKITEEGGILFPRGLWIPPGMSTERSVLGLNAMGAVIEEANFFKPMKNTNPNRSNSPDLAEIIYRSIKRRMESRFLVRGKLPGILIMISSKTSINSFTERRTKEAATNPNIYIRERAVYESAPHRYSGETFRVALGNESKPSRVLTDNEPCPEQMKEIRVPVEFRDTFEKDLEAGIREIAGYSTVTITPFIARRDKIYECIDNSRQHPFSEYIWSHDVAGRFEWSKLAKQTQDGGWQPLYHPKAPRFIGVDLSKSGDSTGIAVGCLGPYVQVQRMGESADMQPTFHIDFVLRIDAATKGEVIQSEIRNLIYELSAHGFFIKAVSADQFQSLGFTQALRQKGYHTREISVDRTSGPYDLVKLAIYENRLSMYHYKPLLKELRELQKNWKNGKVDHPDPSEVPNSSKDVSDALAQVCVQVMDFASKGFQDVPLSQNPAILLEDDTEWILDNAIPVASQTLNAPQIEAEDWRINAEKRLADAQPKHYNGDWRENFQSPFEMG